MRCFAGPLSRGAREHSGRTLFWLTAALVLGLIPGHTSAQTAEAYRKRATEFSQAKSWDEAIASYRKALELEPNDASTHYHLGLALKYKGDARHAVEEFEASLRLRPKWGDAHYNLGE